MNIVKEHFFDNLIYSFFILSYKYVLMFTDEGYSTLFLLLINITFKELCKNFRAEKNTIILILMPNEIKFRCSKLYLKFSLKQI